jgi:DNA repair protein RecN (Recombination protein N)
LVEAKTRLEEVAHSLQGLVDRWQADPAALEESLNRLDLLSRLKKKYGSTVEAILQHADHLRTELHRLENADHHRRDLDERSGKVRSLLDESSRELSQKRKKGASALVGAVQKELGDLGLKSAVFRCRLEPLAEPSSKGIDQVTFEWAPNPGEGIQPLRAIASGGEIARVMLALKSVLAAADAVPTLVFDEVDAGIGGLTAQAVGRKLRSLSRHHQVLCVSHLPQIASCASAHFQVSKRVSKSRTFAVITRLQPEERIHELARLLGSQLTAASVQHAKELLSQNQ